MSDLLLIENGDGGDLVFNGSDLVVIDGFRNMIYLALFGGNIEASTQQFNPGEQRLDWWGNSLLMDNDSSIQFNSDTERLLNKVALNSSSRILIEETVKKDLEFMKSFAEIKVSVTILSTDRIRIDVGVKEPENLQSNEFTYIWDATLNELVIDQGPNPQYGAGILLDNPLDYEI